MKKIVTFLSLITLTSLTKAALIAGWNFNSQSTGQAPTTMTGEHGGTLDLSQLANGSSDATIGSGGTSINKVSGDNNGNDFFVAGGTSLIENGKSIIFSFSTSGYQNIVLTYATERTSSSFTSQTWSYSTDGVNYNTTGVSGSPVSVPTSTYTMETVDFTGASSVNNVSIAYFELTLSGATANTGGDHFDNIQFNVSAVPEPATWGAISALGLLGICGLREWRQKKQAKAA
jgi:hypothetical protein